MFSQSKGVSAVLRIVGAELLQYIRINRVEEHCAVAFNHGIYDVTGRISGKNFHIASPREISFMKKNYIPQFNTEKLERYLKML